MYLAFNTATTGLLRSSLENSHPDQPHVVRFAAAIYDERWREIDHLVTIVRPGPDARLSPEAFISHRISLARAVNEGMEPVKVLNWVKARAPRVRCLVAHHADLEVRIMDILAQRVTGQEWSPPCPTFCTMKASAPILNLPHPPGTSAPVRSTPRQPSLPECVSYFFGEDVDSATADDAGHDVYACIQLFRHLRFERAA